MLRRERVYYPPNIGSFGSGVAQVSKVIWASWLGCEDYPRPLRRLRFQISTNGASVSVAQAGVFSSPRGPCHAGQTFLKLGVDAALPSLTAGAVNRWIDTADLGLIIPPGVHAWALSYFEGTGMPSFMEGTSHTVLGDFLTLTNANPLSTYTNDLVLVLPTLAVVNHAPPYVRGLGF